MSDPYGNASSSSGSSLNSSSHDTEDDHTIAAMLAEDEKLRYDGKLGKRLSHLDSIPHTPRVITAIPDANDATLDHGRLAQRLATYGLAEMQIEGDGNCQFRALADQLFQNPDYHKYIRKEVIKQLKRHRNLYDSYVPMKYRSYVKKMKRLGEWGDHVTLQAAADRFEAKICLITSFRDTCYIEILPKDRSPSRGGVYVIYHNFKERHFNRVVAELLERNSLQFLVSNRRSSYKNTQKEALAFLELAARKYI